MMVAKCQGMLTRNNINRMVEKSQREVSGGEVEGHALKIQDQNINSRVLPRYRSRELRLHMNVKTGKMWAYRGGGGIAMM
uniref:Uncharacterized protein n=1 Tax=Octopus bimaculoides TaxID=37653 RepID=A0A0L8GEK5_OCTBM